jgi:hypothetical protein
MPSFSIIIVNFNTKDLTADCLDSVFSKLSGDFEVIVADNNSSDGSVDYLNGRYGSRIKIISNRENLGFGRANNTAAKIAAGEYLFFLNSDTIIPEDILPQLKICFGLPRVAVAAPSLVLPGGGIQKNSFGKFPNLFNTLLGKLIGNIGEAKAEWVSGAALAIRKSVFDKIGGFDEKYFMYFEDIDLCYQAAELGYEIKIAPDARVIHLGGKSIKDRSVRKNFYYQSQDYFFLKHYGSFSVFLLKLARTPYIFLKDKTN